MLDKSGRNKVLLLIIEFCIVVFALEKYNHSLQVSEGSLPGGKQK
jgi:hypothetical protein